MQLRRFNSTRPLQGHEQEERPHEKWAAETRVQCKCGCLQGPIIGNDKGLPQVIFSNHAEPVPCFYRQAEKLPLEVQNFDIVQKNVCILQGMPLFLPGGGFFLYLENMGIDPHDSDGHTAQVQLWLF